MRIGLVSSEYPPFAGGGIGTYTEIAARAFANAGHEVHVIANTWGSDAAAAGAGAGAEGEGRIVVHPVAALDSRYRPLPPHDRPGDPLGEVCRARECSLFWSFLVADRLAAVCREARLDVVEMPECFAEGYVSLMRRGRVPSAPDPPVVLTLHSPMREITLYNRLRRTEGWVERRAVAEDLAILAADALAAPSARLAAMVSKRLGLAEHRQPVHVIPNPMDLDRAVVPRRRPTGPDRGPRLVYAGRIEPRKGVDHLVDAALLLMPDWPELTVDLVGRDAPAGCRPGSMSRLLRERIPAELRSRFRFRGLLPRPQLLELFASATACVFPPDWDNFPYTCCEAMAAGGCVVVTDTTGMAEIVESGRSGLVVRSGSPEKLAEAIATLLCEPGLARQLGRGAAARVRDVCDPSAFVARKIDLYRGTAERRRGSAGEGRGMATSEVRDRATVAVLVADRGDDEALAATVDSVVAAAGRANLDAAVTVTSELLGEPTPDGDSRALARWLEGVERTRPAFLLLLSAGDALDEEYFEITLRSFQLDGDGAWATTWSLPAPGTAGEVFAGLDFTAPLEMMAYHPVPFAVIRRDRFDDVGGFNLRLPPGWMEWDLYLALLSRGWKGLVVPVWAARHLPTSGRPLPVGHGKAYEMTLEAIAERNPELFRDHGATLWIAAQVDRLSPPCAPVVGGGSDLGGSAIEEGGRRQRYVDLLRGLAEADVDAAEGHVGEAAFFDAHPLGGLGLLAHPPARIAWRVEIAERSFLNLTLGLHPEVYDRAGGGVRYLVTVDGEKVLEEEVDPKRIPADQGWKDLSLDLGRFEGADRRLELVTEPFPGEDASFCTAGWGRAHLASEPFAPPPEDAVFRLR